MSQEKENHNRAIGNETQKEKEPSCKTPQFTITQGMVPDIYVPAWKTNVVSLST